MKNLKEGLTILGVITFMFLSILALSFTVGSCVGELRETKGIKPVISEIWCGDKDCLK